MLDQNFREALEYRICDALANSQDEEVIGLWCDGVLLSEPDDHYSQKFVNDNRQVKMQARIGKDGQSLYSLTLRFGTKALSRFARKLDIIECIPQTDLENWFRIDTLMKEIEVQLD
jgi:hypothetical protein